MPQELPGFYYDAEKNRYFPLKGPIPGSSSSSSSKNSAKKPSLKPTLGTNFFRRAKVRTSKLLQGRELNGNVIEFNKGKCNFVEEVLKKQASQPMVWKYRGTEKMGDGALDRTHICIQTPEGQTEVDIAITGGRNGSLSLFEVGKVGQHFHNGIKFIPDRVRPVIEETKAECSIAPGYIWRPVGASLHMPSNVSCINFSEKYTPYNTHDGFSSQPGLITTLGSETSGGSVYILKISEPLDYSSISIGRRMHEIASFNCTIWAADCNHSASKAAIGTNLGAALINLETGNANWICRSKSDVLAIQLDQSSNIVLCGLRNGAIVTVDGREKARLIKHRIPYSQLGISHQNSSKQWFELKGNMDPSCTLCMPSSICCLVSLQSYDQYFLASSMDGSIKLYDHRMTKRGAIQSYEGHINSHTCLQLGVDQSERFLMAGGEDCNLRLWSMKSGELLFEKFSDAVLSTVRWQRPERHVRVLDENKSYDECSSWLNNWGAWCGSQEGLFYIDWL